jgi:hypothetical protein
MENKIISYHEAVDKHMKGAPERLALYVRCRLTDSSWWNEGKNPISSCGFAWKDSLEGEEFWNAVESNRWGNAMNTAFWKQHDNKTGNDMSAEDIKSGEELFDDAMESLKRAYTMLIQSAMFYEDSDLELSNEFKIEVLQRAVEVVKLIDEE